MRIGTLYIILINTVMGLSFDLSLGDACSVDQNITVARQDASDINFRASFKTNGLKSPQYYSIRLGEYINNKNLEFEFIHHKLYVEDLPLVIDKFEVTDGYNLFLINIVNNLKRDIYYRIGVGTVVVHPDITIDGETNYVKGGGLIPKFWTDGYHWGGISSQISLFYEKKIASKIQFNLETKFVYARTSIPVVGGNFILPNLSFHFLAGLSFGV